MELPSVEQAYSHLQEIPGRGAYSVDLEVRTATLAAAVEARASQDMAAASRDAAATVAASSDAWKASIDRFTKASDLGTAKLTKWSSS